MIKADTFKRGFLVGLGTTWELTKIVLPIYFIVTFLKFTPIMDTLAGWLSPAMQMVGLPGEAAIALVLGNLLNLYAALGAITPLGLSSKEMTIIASMLLISHNLLMESAISRAAGVSGVGMAFFRLTLSIITGLFLNIVL